MPTIGILLQEILTDPEQPQDLTGLPANQVLARVRELYNFLPAIDDISIDEDELILTIPQENPYRVEEALRTYKRAGRTAERGNYQAAVEMYQEALEVVPYHAETRRDLAMADMELGDGELAKQHIVEALRLQPGDAWSYVVLANVLSKMEGKDELAERYYEKAYELAPTDIYVLNGLGALKASVASTRKPAPFSSRPSNRIPTTQILAMAWPSAIQTRATCSVLCLSWKRCFRRHTLGTSEPRLFTSRPGRRPLDRHPVQRGETTGSQRSVQAAVGLVG